MDCFVGLTFPKLFQTISSMQGQKKKARDLTASDPDTMNIITHNEKHENKIMTLTDLHKYCATKLLLYLFP